MKFAVGEWNLTLSGEIVLSDGEIALLGSCGREDSLQNDKQKFPINLIRYANQSVEYKTKMHQTFSGSDAFFNNFSYVLLFAYEQVTNTAKL